jgi:hypothetical protein
MPFVPDESSIEPGRFVPDSPDASILPKNATKEQAIAYLKAHPEFFQTAWQKYNPPYTAGGWVTDQLAKYGLTRPIAAAAGGITNFLVNAAPIALSGSPEKLAPSAARPEVQRLLEQDVVPTIGQAVNPKTVMGGMIRKGEDTLTSIRGVGDVVTAARVRALEDMNRAALNTAMPEGETVSQVGNAGIEEAKDALSAAYDKLYAGKNVIIPKPSIPTGGSLSSQVFKVSPESWPRVVSSASSMENTAIGKAIEATKDSTTLPINEKVFDAVMKKAFWNRIPENGILPASSVKAEMIGDVGKAAYRLSKSSLASDQATGEALFNAKSALQDWLNAATGANKVETLDAAYKASKVLEKAATRGAAQGGTFTPYQLLKASPPGSELNQLARDAQAVMGNNVPNSGTIDRAFWAYVMSHPGKGLASLLGMIPASILYSRPVQSLLINPPGLPAAASALGPAAAEAGTIDRSGLSNMLK